MMSGYYTLTQWMRQGAKVLVRNRFVDRARVRDSTTQLRNGGFVLPFRCGMAGLDQIVEARHDPLLRIAPCLSGWIGVRSIESGGR